jgi:predicted  nucleic acid-binding Zn-ribbon protein
MLHTLQTIELDLEAKARRLHEIQAALGETEALRAARAALEQAEAELRRWQSRQRELELEVRALEQRIASSEQELISGRVRNPKELEGMEANVQSLHHRRQTLEDELLEAMVSVDEHAIRHGEARAAYEQAEGLWRKAQAQLQAEQKGLQQELARLRAERENLIGQLDRGALAEYERLRHRRGGYAVSEVRRGACQVCGVTLPTSLAQAARQAEGLVYCGSCGRILCALS